MQQSGRDGPTDQWRVYSHILHALEHGPFLRLVVQASAGTGKSYLLTTVYLWCLLHGKNVRAAAPTGIAAANVAIEGTDVRAVTLHNLFDFDENLRTKLDFAKLSNAKVADLLSLQVLLVDEFSMMDDGCFTSIEEVLSLVEHTKKPSFRGESHLGEMHLILFGDFKQHAP